MGKRNRQRRLEKQRLRRHRGGDAPHVGPSPGHDSPFDHVLVGRLLAEAANAWGEGGPMVDVRAVALLAAVWEEAGDLVPAVADVALEQALAALWSSGWQPADVARVATKQLSPAHGRLLADVMAMDAERYPAAPPERWQQQLAGAGAERWWLSNRRHLEQWLEREGTSPRQTVEVAAGLLALLWHLPPLPCLGDPPRAWASTDHRQRVTAPAGIDPKILGRVRALLAKAESTTFVEEAEALTAKAQELMARHAIDHALLQSTNNREEPTGRRLGVDDPYASAKAQLLTVVADASRCRAVWTKAFGFSTVFGFAADLDFVEMLYTSLLVQATAAMVAAGARPEQRRSRSRSFRQSFLVSYAARIGQRLREAAEATVAEAAESHGSDLLPVLASRADAVDDLHDRTYPQLATRRLSMHDRAGWIAGHMAADQASLAVGPELDEAASY